MAGGAPVTQDFVEKIGADAYGANYFDVNAGVFVGKEPDYIRWLVETVKSVVDTLCCIDSPDPKAPLYSTTYYSF